MGAQLYVETLVRADLDRVWHLTQDPAQHTRWDLRFGLIEEVPAQDDGSEDDATSGARSFRYSSGIGPLRISGTGTTVGERRRPDGTRTSALRFASNHPVSPIRRGHGWWRYVPTPDGVRFLTGYDYTPSWGRPGAVLDRVVVRRVMGWGTAWSFDRLRLWLERDLAPERALTGAVLDVAARTVAVAWAVLGVLRRPGPLEALLAGAVSVLAVTAPRPRMVPSAARCRRSPHDDTGRHAPTTLSTLREPA